MPDNSQSTLRLHERPVKCAHCGYYCHPQDSHCPQCGEPLPEALPAVTGQLRRSPFTGPGKRLSDSRLEPHASVILQFLPSGTCITASLHEPLILGRRLTPDQTEILDLTDFGAQFHGVSRQHCRLERRDQQLIVTDLGSSNGTYLNSEVLLPQRDYVVGDGDKLILGSLHLIVTFSAIAPE